MLVFSNLYRNKPWFRNVSLIVLAAGIAATSYPFLDPIVLPLMDLIAYAVGSFLQPNLDLIFAVLGCLFTVIFLI